MAGLLGIIEQNTWFTEEARTFLAYLILKGEISDIDIGDESEDNVQSAINELAFDCTKLILKKHREITWFIEYFCERDPVLLGRDYSSTPAKMLAAFRNDFPPEVVQEEYSIDINRRLVPMYYKCNEAMEKLKMLPRRGERFYEVLYHTYISPGDKTEYDITDALGIRHSYYFELKKAAISALSVLLWPLLPAQQVRILIEAAKRCA